MSTQIEEVTFYPAWLPLPKEEFNVLAMIAEQGGSYSGNYADMCRYLTVTPQSRNRNAIRRAIESLSAQSLISCESRGRTHYLKVIPKGKGIVLPRPWVQSVIRHDYSGEAVAFAHVLKVFIWIADNQEYIATNDMIAADLCVSPSTVVSAKNVLEREYEIITKRKVSEKLGEDFFKTLGQDLTACAWWKEI